MERSCPGLDALAKEGQQPRDGKNGKLHELVDAVTNGYTIKAGSCPSSLRIIRCGNPVKREINLHDLALHNATEHDLSLFHRNAKDGEKYAPTKPSLTLTEELCTINGKDNSHIFEDFVNIGRN
ncbi:hypothetical protein A7U60_g3125 [Sanghuangporus baumii]|uniref:Heme haloperoxidase family profile domain-containing protein n=1 Tax=Sanghuangporus baumii TaxID=108892 RepID=A0A9Q5I0Y7_SANBA|nr:hypothetical protein A7U60_g3125 [Sanghuangporus baumii]